MSQTCPKCQRLIDLPGPPILFCCFCGSSMTGALPPTVDATMTLPPSGAADPGAMPDRLGGYRLLRKLGQGGMGAVFEGEEETTGRRVAVKVIDAEASGDALERFRQEGRLASAIDHPRCVFVYAADEDAGRPYIVLELMPGQTLEDLVQERGPLPLEEALRYTFDLIEGLEQVHRLGVIHRDVKPSNCFLDENGRLKVGDFGLARSLAPSAKLTRTGAFVGTPLFAAPEQILNQPLDPRADVYAVCATLYHALTGHAPHDKGDTDYLAVLARVVSDDPPSVQARRAGLPPAIAHILARGLARDREKRWPDLEELRLALASVRPGRASWMILAARFCAFVVDYIVLYPVMLTALVVALGREMWASIVDPSTMSPPVWRRSLTLAAAMVYFTLAEGLSGRTVGKWLMGLRVSRSDILANPGLVRAMVRAFLLLAVPILPMLVGRTLAGEGDLNRFMLLNFATFFAMLAIYGGMLATMRPGNGFRGLHELASGTQVVSAATRRVRTIFPAVRDEPNALPEGWPETLGHFALQGLIHEGGGEQVVTAFDAALGRQVWLWLRPREAPEVSAERRSLLRAARLRWLASGTHAEQRWDAFLAPRGCPLSRVIPGSDPLGWDAVQSLLEALLAELREATTDHTLPDELSLDQVWISPDGAVQIVELTFTTFRDHSSPLDLVGRVATLLLDRRQSDDTGPAPLPAVPLPGHARNWLGRLPWFGGDEDRIKVAQEELQDQRERPAEVTHAHRAVHLGMVVAVLTLCGGCFGLASTAAVPNLMLSSIALGELQFVESRLRVTSVADASTLVVPGTPVLTRLAFAQIVPHEANALREMSATRSSGETYVAARRSSVWQPQRLMVDLVIASGEAQRATLPRPNIPPLQQAPQALKTWRMFQTFRVITWTAIGSLMALILLVMISTLSFRGGLRYWLLGLEVVRLDGRPAGRWRCVGRTLLGWAPPLLLLGIARYLEDDFWLHRTPASDMTMTAVIVPALQIAAYLFMVAVILSALVWPTRSLHDRLAGTCLVPA